MDYKDKQFINPDGTMNMHTNVEYITDYFVSHGLKLNNTKQTINGFTMFPSEYFCPKDSRTLEIKLTKNTYSIHHFAGSWSDKRTKQRLTVKKLLGPKLMKIVIKIMDKLGIKRELLIKMILYSAPLILNDISWWVINSSDKIMIEAMLTAGELGLYTVASKIPGLINTFVNIFSQAWGVSSIKEIESTNDNNYYSNVFHYYSILAFGASIFFVAIIKVFMLFYVGNSFRDAWRYVPLLLVAASFSAISSYYGAMYGALQKSIECMLSTVIGGAVNIILNYVLIKSIGTQGAILATLIAFALIAFIRLFGVNRYIHMPITWGSFAIDISIAIVEAVLVSLGFHIVLVPILAIMLFLCIHIKDIAHIVNTFKLVRK